MNKIIDKLRDSVSPLPSNQKELGYKPNTYIKVLRKIARVIISVFKLDGNSRLMVELQQMLDPHVRITLPNQEKLIFTTGHGRLLWRANTLLSEEKAIIKWIDDFTNDDVFYDIGANVGNYTLYAAKTKGVKVFAFEPEINNLQLLYSNIYKNNLYDLCIPLGIACHDRTILEKFYIRGFTKGDAMHSVERRAKYLKESSDLFVQHILCMTLDDIIDTFNLPIPTKIKIDVDTNELKVIKGLVKYLNKITEICIELDSSFDEHVKVINILQDNGFEVFTKEHIKRQFSNSLYNYFFINKNSRQ